VADYTQPSDMGVDEKLFFHLFNLAILNSYMVFLHVLGRKLQRFRLTLLRNILAVAGQEQGLEKPVGRLATASVNIHTLENSFIKHWLCASKSGCCCVCCARDLTWKECVQCLKCNVALCV
jgi:hypothetical protein